MRVGDEDESNFQRPIFSLAVMCQPTSSSVIFILANRIASRAWEAKDPIFAELSDALNSALSDITADNDSDEKNY